MAPDRDHRSEEKKLTHFKDRLKKTITKLVAETETKLNKSEDLIDVKDGLRILGNEPTAPSITGAIIGAMVYRPQTMNDLGEFFPTFKGSALTIINHVTDSHLTVEEVEEFVMSIQIEGRGFAAANPEARYDMELSIESAVAVGQMYAKIHPLVERLLSKK